MSDHFGTLCIKGLKTNGYILDELRASFKKDSCTVVTIALDMLPKIIISCKNLTDKNYLMLPHIILGILSKIIISWCKKLTHKNYLI